ncbi:TonB-dependent receptor [Fulvivirga ligni]|uniref:TonB-dependent receptor n=1 Tax=Fulvivirga ligni TaxID=2904246 RepID=UPI001F47C84D|nr:TonB-dependent receptor [Fulvivirga ligni]UII19206.1 TonB-dependent receptor [Fulvivirga ligni]
MNKKLIYIVFFFCLVSMGAYAQDGWGEESGEIEDVEINIIKDLQITLPKANRNFEKIPPLTTDDKPANLQYFFSNLNFALPDIDVKMRPLRIKDESLNKLYGNYVKAGFGNYATPYLEAYLNNKRSKEYSYGAHFNYLNSAKGPVDGKNSGSGNLDLDLFGKYFTKNATFSGDVGFNQRKYHFYGYPEGIELDEDTLKQSFNDIYVKAQVESANKKSPFHYTLGGQYDRLSDKYDARESEGQLFLKSNYDLNEDAFIRLNASLSSISRKDELVEKQSRTLFKLRPTVGFDLEGFKVEAGFNLAYENDSLGDGDKLHFYPVAQASYPFTESIMIYAGIRGDMQKNSLRSLSTQNPYMRSNVPIYHSNKDFDLYGGFKGKLGAKIAFEAGLSVANYKNMYFFVNDSTDQSKFDIVYDEGNTAVVNIFGEIGINSSEKLRVAVRGDYWGYGTDGIDEAWHRPNYKLSGLATYNLYGKFLFDAELYALGGMKGRDNDGDAVNLSPALDFNLKTEYLVSDQVSVFVKFNNIFSKEYELYYHYPSRGFQFMAGLTYNF